MVVSVIGIIVLQLIWISNALAQKEQAFSRKVTRVLNDFNKEVDEHETVVFIEEEFGGLDSLIQLETNSEENHFSDSSHSLSGRSHQSLRIKMEGNDGDSQTETMISTIRHFDGEELDSEEFMEGLDLGIHFSDSTQADVSEAMRLLSTKQDQVESIIQRFTFEKMLSDDLEDRISMEEINEVLRESLEKEDISSNYEFAIFNESMKAYEDSFVSSEFDSTAEYTRYKKRLFPNDHLRRKALYRLEIYFDESSDQIWSGIWGMVILSILFSALIIACFGYAVYYIFKQKKISQVKNDFINNMTHELKTPLASISLAAASIKHPKVINDPSEIEHFVDIIHGEENRMRHHFERLLEIAMIAKGELKLHMESANLYQILEKSLKNVDLALNEHEGLVNLSASTQNALINGDSFHLTNAVTNILDNSIKYRREALKIKVLLNETPTTYSLRIEDNGIGMSKRSIQLAFDEFYRAETGNIHSQRGFGIGLSYVQGIMDAHGGNVSIESALGKGTTVHLTIPKATQKR